MIAYRVLGDESATIAELTREMNARGCVRDPQTWALTIVSAPTLGDARRILSEMTEEERRRTLILDLPDVLDGMEAFAEGKLPQFLERYQPLGLLRLGTEPPSESNAPRFGFVGPAALAEPMGTGVIKRYSCGSYGTWFQRDGEPPADFILRLLAKLA